MAVKPSSIESLVDSSNNVPVAISGGGVASGATDSGNPVKTGGIYNTSAPTLTNGQRGDTQMDANANTKVTLATLVEGENQTTHRLNNEPIYSFANILTATTTTVKSGAGTLHSITFNKPVVSEVWTLYDNTAGSGTKIGTITLPGTLLTQGPVTALYDISFATGLTIVSGSTTDGTVAYR